MDMHALSFAGGCVLLAWSVLLIVGEIGGEWDRISAALKGENK